MHVLSSIGCGRSPGWDFVDEPGVEYAGSGMTMEPPRKIAVFHAGSLGDLILALRLASALSKRFSSASLTVYARTDLSSLPGAIVGADTFRSFERCGLHLLFDDSASIVAPMQAELAEFDLIVSALGGKDAIVSRRVAHHAQGRVFAFDPRARTELQCHITDQWLDDLANAGLDLPRDTRPEIIVSDCAVDAGRTHLEHLIGSRQFENHTAEGTRQTEDSPATGTRTTRGAARLALLHPGSGGRSKCWPCPNWLELARRLIRCSRSPAFIIGPVELDLYGEDFRASLDAVAPVVYDQSLAGAAPCVSACDVYVGNDAGLTHLAAAMGVKTVALFGPTDPVVWRPLGPRVVVLRGRGGTSAPFTGLSVERVIEAVLCEL